MLLTQVIVARLLGQRSCVGCEYLYFQDVGYSNYTVTDTLCLCALDQNPHLVGRDVYVPYDWSDDLASNARDRWEPTRDSMCKDFTPLGEHCVTAHFDVDGETSVAEATEGFSPLAILAITEHLKK